MTREDRRLALVVCDLAGTTVKDPGVVESALRGALEAHDVHCSPRQLTRVRGGSKRDAIRYLVLESTGSSDRAEAVYEAFRANLTASLRAAAVRPIDGAEVVLRGLRASGIHVAITTGFEREIAAPLLERIGWHNEVIDVLVCADDVGHGRPAPDMILRAMKAVGVTDARLVANVGDTVNDLQSAANAGVRWNVGVLSGAHSRATLEGTAGAVIIPSIERLADALGDWNALETPGPSEDGGS